VRQLEEHQAFTDESQINKKIHYSDLKSPNIQNITPKGVLTNSSFINDSMSDFTSSFVENQFP
jgi:hypothetical protein